MANKLTNNNNNDNDSKDNGNETPHTYNSDGKTGQRRSVAMLMGLGDTCI